MKDFKIILFTAIGAILIFPDLTFAKFIRDTTITPNQTINIDSLSKVILDAHRTFSAFSEIAKQKAVTKNEMILVNKSDSIFKARRGVINSLSNNIDLLNDAEKNTALAIVSKYVNSALLIKKSNFKITNSPFYACKLTSYMAESNSNIASKFSFSENTQNKTQSITYEIRPDNQLEMDVSFNCKDSNDFVFYLFPKNWILRNDMLAPCYNGSWLNIDSCIATLNKYAYKWNIGMERKITNIYSGKHTLMIYNRATSTVFDTMDLIIPTQNRFIYSVNR